MIRIKILRSPPIVSLDGIHLAGYKPGRDYVVGTLTGALMLAEGWAEPMPLDAPALVVPPEEPVHVARRAADVSSPPNLIRETFPPYFEHQLTIAADRARRRRRRE